MSRCHKPKKQRSTKNRKRTKHSTTISLLDTGIEAHQSGQLAEAEKVYRRVLVQDKHNADALHLLGCLHQQRGKLREAEDLMRQSLALREEPFYLCNLGILLQETQRLPEAEATYRRVLQLKPDHIDAHYNLAILLQETKRMTEAEVAYRHVLELKQNYPGAYNNLGNVLRELKQYSEAETAFTRALVQDPHYVAAHNNLGVLLKETARLLAAETAFRQALELNPEFADAHNNLGNLLKQLDRWPEAEAAYLRALELKPDYADAHNNLGTLLKELNRCPAAEVAFRRALTLQPSFVAAHSNLGILLHASKHWAEAEAAFNQALKLEPSFVDATYNLSLLHLTLGWFNKAWSGYESRYNPNKSELNVKSPELPYPQWRGEPLLGKSLIIWPEQGYGDYIQFIRYAALLKEHGLTRLTLLCPLPLEELLKTMEGVDAVITDVTAIPDHDYWSFPLSLPLYFNTTIETIPAKLPYLQPLPDHTKKWRARLQTEGLKVGLVWKGRPEHKNDANRSLPHLETLAPLWGVKGATFISLQKGQGEEDALQVANDQPLISLGTDINNFADTAAIVAQLDLVICVDTALAHLAGALAKPCWVLLPYDGTDWRWLLDRTDSPWYPGSLRLFRQTTAGNWAEPITQITKALKTVISNQVEFC